MRWTFQKKSDETETKHSEPFRNRLHLADVYKLPSLVVHNSKREIRVHRQNSELVGEVLAACYSDSHRALPKNHCHLPRVPYGSSSCSEGHVAVDVYCRCCYWCDGCMDTEPIHFHN
jgi:hypothetical protein